MNQTDRMISKAGAQAVIFLDSAKRTNNANVRSATVMHSRADDDSMISRIISDGHLHLLIQSPALLKQPIMDLLRVHIQPGHYLPTVLTAYPNR